MKRQIRCLGSGWQWYVRAGEHVKSFLNPGQEWTHSPMRRWPVVIKNHVRCLPSFLLALMFGSLAVVEWLFSHGSGWLPVAHVMHNVDGLTPDGRPTYTLQYLEWNVNVPILFILSGTLDLCQSVYMQWSNSAWVPSCLAWQSHVWDLWRR